MRTLLTALASVLLLLAGSCTSPLATLKTGFPSLPPIGPGETQLVFHLSSGAKAVSFYDTYSATEIQYLVVQLHSKYGQGSKFAGVAVTAPTVAVNIKGLVAGPWEILVSAYDWDGLTGSNSPWTGSQDSTQPTLLYTGMDQLSIQPGTSNPVTLLLYKPGDVSNVDLIEAKMVNDVTINPVPPLAAIPTTVVAGSASFQVAATAWNALLSTTASDQSFSWYSDNPDVAGVDTTGHVFPKNPGTAKITAVSRESEKYGTNKFAQFTLTVESPLVGYWKQSTANSYLKIFRHTDGSLRWEGLNSVGNIALTFSPTSALTDTKVRGAIITNGPTSWSFEAKEYVDYSFSAGLPMTNFNKWMPTSPISTQTVTMDTSGRLVWGTTAPPTYDRVGIYVPVTGLDIDATAALTTGSSTLVAKVTTGSGAPPTVPAVYWMSSSSGIIALNGGYSAVYFGTPSGLPGYPLASIAQTVSFNPGSATLTLLAIDFDPVYRASGTAAGPGDAVVFTQTPTVTAGGVNPTGFSLVSMTTNFKNGTLKVWAVPTPFWAAIPAPTWTSSNAGAVYVAAGPIFDPNVSWIAPGTANLQATITGGFSGSPMTSNVLGVTAQ